MLQTIHLRMFSPNDKYKTRINRTFNWNYAVHIVSSLLLLWFQSITPTNSAEQWRARKNTTSNKKKYICEREFNIQIEKWIASIGNVGSRKPLLFVYACICMSTLSSVMRTNFYHIDINYMSWKNENIHINSAILIFPCVQIRLESSSQWRLPPSALIWFPCCFACFIFCFCFSLVRLLFPIHLMFNGTWQLTHMEIQITDAYRIDMKNNATEKMMN